MRDPEARERVTSCFAVVQDEDRFSIFRRSINESKSGIHRQRGSDNREPTRARYQRKRFINSRPGHVFSEEYDIGLEYTSAVAARWNRKRRNLGFVELHVTIRTYNSRLLVPSGVARQYTRLECFATFVAAAVEADDPR